MYFVKSCMKRNNIATGKTIRIGSLHEYRETEESEIADPHEGTYTTQVKMEHIHIPSDYINYIFYNHHSYATTQTEILQQRGPSPILKGCDYFPIIKSSISLDNLNRFILCMSLVDHPEDARHIFDGYDDMWYFSEEKAENFARSLAMSLNKEILNLLNQGVEVFDEPVSANGIKINYQAQKINYAERETLITNRDAYTRPNYINELMSGVRFIKPLRFSPEKEVRMCFDIYHNNKLVHPKIKSIIVDAKEALKLI